VNHAFKLEQASICDVMDPTRDFNSLDDLSIPIRGRTYQKPKSHDCPPQPNIHIPQSLHQLLIQHQKRQLHTPQDTPKEECVAEKCFHHELVIIFQCRVRCKRLSRDGGEAEKDWRDEDIEDGHDEIQGVGKVNDGVLRQPAGGPNELGGADAGEDEDAG
jgi:hypothetical protein